MLRAPRLGLPEILDVYTQSGMAWVIGICTSRALCLMMMVAGALRVMDPSMEEAARVGGLMRDRQQPGSPSTTHCTGYILSGAVLVVHHRNLVRLFGIRQGPRLVQKQICC